MVGLLNHPEIIFLVAFSTLTLSVAVGAFFRKGRKLETSTHENYTIILTAALTLLGLIIGFSFSIAIGRYDQRKNYEEAEANAIGTEYLRADLLPSSQGATVRELLKRYLEQRILFYTASEGRRSEINARTAQLQGELWSAVKTAAATEPTAVATLVIAGMNDVLNSQGYTQADWWYRIPHSAWLLMASVAMCCCFLVGYSITEMKMGRFLIPVLPLIVSIALYLIADIDSPRTGEVKVVPLNLKCLSESIGCAPQL